MELEDQFWFPTFFRDQQTAFIGFVAGAFGIYNPLLPQLQKILASNGDKTWTDCCSGAAGPVLYFQEKLKFKGNILLTDKFPNKTFKENKKLNIAYLNNPLDILKDKIPNKGLVTMFNAFHHFNLQERKIIIDQLIKTNRPFLIAEILQPNVLDAIKIFVTAIVGQVLLAPFIKPFSFKRLFFTYFIPLNIVTVLWDGIASVIRAIPFSHLKQLAETIDSKGFEVKAIKHKTALAVITYIVGKPVNNG